MREALAFDDVLLVPGDEESSVRSRRDPVTSTNIGSIELEVPLISSPMDTVTEFEMAYQLGLLGGMGIIHRFMSPRRQCEIINDLVLGDTTVPIVPAIGVSGAEKSRFDTLMHNHENNIDMISIDIANGHHALMREMIEYVRKLKPSLEIMAGNVATESGYSFLADLGADAVRVGIGGGSACKTRIQTGFGVPTLESLLMCKNTHLTKYPDVAVIADGGIKYPSDIVKSLVAGADAVMLGGLFAGTKESPGDIIYTNDGKAWKTYRGMASAEVQRDTRGGMRPGTVAEGISQLTPYKGSLERVVSELSGGLKVGMAYANSYKIEELRGIEMIRITGSGVNESHAHGTKRR